MSVDPSTPVARTSAAPPGVPRPSATLVVARDAAQGLEVLLSRRAERGDHNSGAWVFPGGLLDASDRAAHRCCADLDDGAASARLGVDAQGLDYWIAAVRECFEESGLLFALDARGGLLEPDAGLAERLAPWRGALHRGERTLADLCDAFGLRLAVDRLAYLSHWITPPIRPKRFDTRFFVAAAPPQQSALHDGTEMVEQLWLRPADALAQRATLKLLTPTQKTLELLARFERAAALLAWAGAPTRRVHLTVPRIGRFHDGPRPVVPDEPAWAELGKLDAEGRGDAWAEIRPGHAVRLSPRVIRVTADNGSVMTGPGTNTYLVGGGARNEWAVIDPGPPSSAHVDAILAAAPGAIRWIFATHTHLDHSPATAELAARTGARVHGRVAAYREWQDESFSPEVALEGGERIALAGDATLRVFHTPGHASNHLCYLLEEERLLFTGDHLMQLSTVVINPPDGDMAAYLASLRGLLAEDGIEWLAPGHGFLMAEPRRVIEGVIAHRLKREAKVVDALRAQGGEADVDALLPLVYDDVPPRMHPMARRSLAAHLDKLRRDGAAREHAGRWTLVRDAAR